MGRLIFVLGGTAIILFFAGRLFKQQLEAGHWWIMVPGLVLPLATAWFLDTQSARNQFLVDFRRLSLITASIVGLGLAVTGLLYLLNVI